MEAYFDNESGEPLVDNATVFVDIGGSSNMKSSEMQLKGGWCQGEDGIAWFEKSEMPLEQPGVMTVVEEPGVQSFEASLDKCAFSTGIEAAILSNRISPAEDGDMSPVVHTRVLARNEPFIPASQTTPKSSALLVPVTSMPLVFQQSQFLQVQQPLFICENEDRNSADSTQQEKENEYIIEEDGTVSALLYLKHGVLVGSEGKINTKRKIDGVDVAIFSRDDEVKFRKILKNVCISASGSKNRLNELCHHLPLLLKKSLDDVSFYEATDEKDDVLSVVGEVQRWLYNNKLDEIEKLGEVSRGVPLTLYVVGYCREKKCLAFLMGDKTDVNYVDDLFGAIGGGARFANQFMSDESKKGVVHKDMKLEDAKDLMLGALLCSTFSDVSCGGIFQVHWITSESCLELPRIHAIDAAIRLDVKFKDKHLFVFDKNTYEVMNHHYLRKYLQSLGFHPKMPATFGYIRELWKFFVVEMENHSEIKRIFAMAEKIGLRSGVRRLEFSIDKDGRRVNGNMVILAASQSNLKIARRTPYLEHLV
ncbi:hypothetical protein OROGR_020360 [Orobanche gracilis]